QCVRLRRDAIRIRNAMRILPASSLQSQNVLSEHLSVFGRRLGPIFPDRSPRITKSLFVSVTVLGNNCSHSFRVRHRQTEACWFAIIEYVECKAVDLECSRERLDRHGQSIEGVSIFSFGWNFRKSETREVRCDHAVMIGEAWNEFAKHER